MIYRQVALDRLSSPEQLDQLMKVTRPTGWMALGSLSMVLVSALVWGVFGNLPEKASGMGIFIRTGGVIEIPSVGSGRLAMVLVKPGDEVKAGTAVAHLILPELEMKARNAEKALRRVQESYRTAMTYHKEGASLDVQDQTFQGTTFESSIKWYGEQVRLLEERLGVQEQLLSDGLISVDTVISTRHTLAETRRQQDSTRVQLERIGVNRLQSTKSRVQELFKSAQDVTQAEQQLEEITLDLGRQGHVMSIYAGRVIEVFFGAGRLVNAGDSILSLEQTNKDLSGTIWISASEGKGVKPGMTVQLVPSAVKQEEYGFLLGKVLSVSPYPSTTKGIKNLLENDILINTIEKQGPSVAVDVQLIEDGRTPSGYKWTSSKGPDIRLSSGTMCSANVITRTVRPISLVIPMIRKKLGI